MYGIIEEKRESELSSAAALSKYTGRVVPMSYASDSTTSGIYVITCLPTGKIYVGSSNNIRKRWSAHRSALIRGRHINKHLQNAWDKYGATAFKFEVIERCEQYETLNREQYWLDLPQPFDEVGFNIGTDASAPTLGRKLTSVERDQRREAGKKRSPFFKGKHHSAESRMRISVALRGRTHTPESRIKMSIAKTGLKHSQETRAKLSAAHKGKARQDSNERQRKEFIVIAPDGIEMKVKGLAKFCCEQNLNRAHMSAVATGKRKHHKGWRCRYA